MSLLALAWKSLKQRRLASSLTVFSIALGVALAIAVISLRASARKSYTAVAQGYDLLLGPTHGSSLQNVLNTMFQIGDPSGTIPWEVYEQVQEDPRVAVAVPYALGDYFRQFPVAGTSKDLFTVLTDTRGRPVGDELSGRVFREGAWEAVFGSVAAQSTGIRIGDGFQASHGGPGGEEHGEVWEVVGILRPTGTPTDRAIYIPLKTFYAVEGHREEADNIRKARGNDDHGHSHSHGSGDEDHHVHGLTAIGLKLKTYLHRFEVQREFMRDRSDAQASIPVDEVGELMSLVGRVDGVFELIAWLVVFVAGIGILVSLYSTIHGRRREIAILRALGAKQRDIFGVVLLESMLLTLTGGVLGLALGHAGVAAAAPHLLETYGVLADPTPSLMDLQVLGIVLVLGFLTGLLPAWRALRTPVARHLYPTDA